jgi:hypothetical protein
MAAVRDAFAHSHARPRPGVRERDAGNRQLGHSNLSERPADDHDGVPRHHHQAVQTGTSPRDFRAVVRVLGRPALVMAVGYGLTLGIAMGVAELVTT